MDKHVYLVRHGEPIEKFGSLDPGLTLLGFTEARAAFRNLSTILSPKIICSPRLRTVQTAQVIANGFNKTHEINDAFAEVPIIGESPSETRTLVRSFFDMQWEETKPELQSWRHALLKALVDLPSNSIVVTHFGVINCIVGTALCISSTLVFKPAHCSITKISIKTDSFSVDVLGRQKHESVST